MKRSPYKPDLWHRLVGYRMKVPISEGHGPTVVFLHGIGSNASYWQKTIDKLYRDHRVIAVDLLGFGDSPKPKSLNYSVAEQAMSLHQTLLRHGVWGQCCLVGFSLGALVAIEFADRYPGKVNKLVLVSPPIYMQGQLGDEVLGKWQATFGEVMNTAYFRFYRQLRRQPHWTRNFLNFNQRLRDKEVSMQVDDENWYGFAMSLRNAIEQQHPIPQLRRAKMPIEIFIGRFDPIIIRANIVRLRKLVPGAKIEWLSGGHELPPKYPSEIAKAVRDKT